MATVLDPEFDKELVTRLKELPKVVQDAIESADIEQRLRDLANTHKLHVDQWQALENEVMLTLLGFEDPADLTKNLKENVSVSEEVATSLAADISKIVFEPIRQELERELEHPEAKTKEVSGVEAAREQVLTQGTGDGGQGTTSAPTATPPLQPATSPPVAPATPPPTPPIEKAIRAPASGAYKLGEPSVARKDIHDDPYREPPA